MTTMADKMALAMADSLGADFVVWHVMLADAALAVLEAMREPTEPMCDRASDRHRWGFGATDARLAWEDMIDAAIAEHAATAIGSKRA